MWDIAHDFLGTEYYKVSGNSGFLIGDPTDPVLSLLQLSHLISTRTLHISPQTPTNSKGKGYQLHLGGSKIQSRLGELAENPSLPLCYIVSHSTIRKEIVVTPKYGK